MSGMGVRMWALVALLVACGAVLGGCASPDPRYHTLAQDASVAATPGAVTPGQEPVWIEVAPVRVPEGLNRTQVVVTDRGGLQLLDLERWTAPLPDEMRDALSQRLQLMLGAVDTYQQGLSDVAPVFRITTDVVRLEAVLGQRASATLQWTVRRLPDGKVVAGRTVADLGAPADVEGVVAAYRQAVAAVASDIAGGVRTAGRPVTVPPDGAVIRGFAPASRHRARIPR